MLLHLPWKFGVFFCNSFFSQQDWVTPVSQCRLPEIIWLARSNLQLDKYLWLFSLFVFNTVCCTNTAAQLQLLVYWCCYGSLHGDNHWCFPVTGNCFQSAVCSLIHCILKELKQILQWLSTSALSLPDCSRGCFYLFWFYFSCSCLTWSRLKHLCWIHSS